MYWITLQTALLKLNFPSFPWASSKNIFLVELSTLGTVDHTDLPELSATERIGYKIIFLCH